MVNPLQIRKDFPIFHTQTNGRSIVYLDSTATTLKPRPVLDAVAGYYEQYSANVFRGIYPISEKATEAYEGARKKVALFIHAGSVDEIVFTRNTTEAINLVAYAWAMKNLAKGDHITTTIMEHHSNFVPWQQIAVKKGSTVNIWNINKSGQLILKDLDKFITRKTKLLAITALSNVLGTINPIQEILYQVKKINPQCMVVVDAAQWVPHMAVDVTSWGADFVVFSGHKMLGPTGIGVLWAKSKLLEEMDPFLYGGEMISEVHTYGSVFKKPPHKFEAGTPHIAGAIGLGAAIDYLTGIGMQRIRDHEKDITSYTLARLSEVSGLQYYGPSDAELRGGVVAFSIKNIHPHDIAQVLADRNICVRAGYHCAMPLHDHLKIPATTRASFYIYTTKQDIDVLISGLRYAVGLFR